MRKWLAGSLLLLFLLVSPSSLGGTKTADPIAHLRGLQQEMKKLLVTGPAGWEMIRDLDRYYSIQHQMDQDWYRIAHEPQWAINWVFGPYSEQAHRVASCESGHSIYAVNGQYLGMFQMGSSERRTYSLGRYTTAMDQARAAYRYFIASGRDWSPWQCKP